MASSRSVSAAGLCGNRTLKPKRGYGQSKKLAMHFVASIENELKMPEPVERIQYLDTKSTQRETSTRNTPVNYQTVETEPIENAKKKSFFSFGLDFLGDERESGSQSEAESGLDMYGVDDEYVPDIPKVEKMAMKSAKKPPRHVSLNNFL